MPTIGILEITAYLVVVNIVCFAAFALDKRRARNKQQRLSERSLLWLCAVGGSVGGLIARRLLRHKTVKEPFSTILGIIWVVQVGMIVLAIALFLQKSI